MLTVNRIGNTPSGINSVQFKGKKELLTNDKSNNNEFDFSEAAKNFGKGAISPVTAAIKHPFLTVGLLAGTVAACSVVPILGPAMLLGFGALSVGQMIKGSADAVKNYNNGEYDKAEKSFDLIGQGTVGTLLTLLGVKQSAQVSKEAKMMSELNVKVLDKSTKEQILSEVQNNKFMANLKEIISLFTTKSGLKAAKAQFNPEVLKYRTENFLKFFKPQKVEETTKRKVYKTTEQKVAEFKASPEGIRRAGLSDEQVEQEIVTLFDKAFDELGIPKNQRPNLEIKKNAQLEHGGSYGKSRHTLEINPDAYRSGTFELDDVVMHEATHCKEALLRAGIPKERAQEIVKNELVSRILNGESEEIIVRGGLFGPEMMKAPKLPQGMKEEFAQLAKDMCYTEDSALSSNIKDFINHTNWKAKGEEAFNPETLEQAEKALEPLFKKLHAMVDKHPQYSEMNKPSISTEDDAFTKLLKYVQSEQTRYQCFADVKINRGTSYQPNYVDVPELTGEQLAQAEKSLIDNITTIEGNGRVAGLNGMFASNKSFNQYQFSPEEVLAQKNGNNFLIRNLTAKMNEMKASGTLTPEQEADMLKIIEKAKAIIEYKTKGLEYYEQYTKMINNPSDTELAKTVKALEEELNILNEKMNPAEYETVTRLVTKFGFQNMPSRAIPRNAIYEMLAELSDKQAA
ncbi:hypothetical protein J6O86_04575 [bacterium]|nr:hypothetical protein [bacterium]